MRCWIITTSECANFLIRGFDPLNDAREYGKALLPIAREKAAQRAIQERAS